MINILGLSTGLACALFIFLWVQDEMGIDAFHEKGDHLYQVMQSQPQVDDVAVGNWTPGPLAEAVKAELPEVKDAISVKYADDVYDGIIQVGERYIKARPYYVEDSFFDFFSFPLIYGDKNTVLNDKKAIVISEHLALKLFSTKEEAIGRTVQWSKKIGEIVDFSGDFTVTGIFDNKSDKSSNQFEILFSFEFLLEKSPGISLWANDQAGTYVLLNEGVDVESLNHKITALVGGKREAQHDFFLQKFETGYLYDKYENGIQAGGKIEYLWLFSIIAVLILVIASINFMNLSTAKASIRVKEIGAKKTLGASRQQLIIQFVQESIVISLAALLIAIVLVRTLLPEFNEVTGKQLSVDLSIELIAVFLGVALLTGLLSSIYPALYLSGFNPIEVLKGKISMSFGEVWIRKALVVFQFSVSAILIVTVLVIYQQMDFIQSKNLGFDRDNILSFKKEGALESNLENFLTNVRSLNGVAYATNSSGNLIESNNFTWGIEWPGKNPDEWIQINPFITNYQFLETFDIELIEGRYFSKELSTEQSKVILNQAAVESMRIENPLGKTVTLWGEEVEIIGISENFHYQSLYQDIEPCIFKLFPEGNNYGDEISIKIRAGSEKTTVGQIADIYEAFNPGYPFEFSFVDETYQAVYESEQRISILSRFFAGLAILISCLGLFGLAAFTAERRTKEIGIRKIMGSSTWGVVSLLSRDFTKMIVIAIVIALPLSYLLATYWLEGFSYRIELTWQYFASAAIITLVIAWLTVGFQTFKASRINPTECLQHD